MGFFTNNTKKKIVKNKALNDFRQEYVAPADIKITEQEINQIEKDYDFSGIPPDVVQFAKYYIACGGNAHAALVSAGLANNTSVNGERVKASSLLRKLRSIPAFWDMLGLGYLDLQETVDRLKITKPEVAAAIIMKVNKEDQTNIDLTGTVKIIFEKDLDD